jgi:hypothetical protein
MDREDLFTGAKIFATIAGFLMIAAAMYMSMANSGRISNGYIAIENAKAELTHNVNLQDYSNLNGHVIANNLIFEKFSSRGNLFVFISILCGIFSFILWIAGIIIGE